MSAPRRTISVACLACDTVQSLTLANDKPGQRFTCVSCGKLSVLTRKPAAATVEAPDPVKPWALSENDRRLLRSHHDEIASA